MSLSGAHPRVFVSYARRDGETFASELRYRLEAEGVPLWRDREGMEGGRDWWLQITAAIDQVEFLVLVMTEAALQSPLVRREWRYARQKGVSVYPVIADARIEFTALPRWMRSVHFYDLEREWTKFINDLNRRPMRVRVPFMVEDLPVDFVARAHEYERLAAHLLDREREEPIAITAALRGAGGYGKTALARALCHDEAIQNAFDDGILWVTLGEQPGDLTGRVEDLIFMLSGQRPGFSSIEAATASLAELLADRDILIVIDDVWDAAHLAPFLQGGERCARIITTRLADVLPTGAQRIDVDAMRHDEAVALVGYGLSAGAEAELGALAARLGEWPLLLKLVNAALRDRVLNHGQAIEPALAYVNKALDKRGLTFFDSRDAGARHKAVAKTLGVSIAQLSGDEEARFDELAVFPEDADIPLDTLTAYWSRTGSFDELDTEGLCDRLNRLSLVLEFDPTARYIRLHDVVRQFLLTRLEGRLAALHGELLDASCPASGVWADLPPQDPYWWSRLFTHLLGAMRREELLRTACDLRYLTMKTLVKTTAAVEGDLLQAQGAAPDNAAVQALRRSYVQCAHILARCRTIEELRATIYSRVQHVQELDTPARSFAEHLREPHLEAQHPLPDLPHPAHVRTLEGHRGVVLACAVSADGARIATAGSDRLIKVWDARTGSELLTLAGHTAWVRCLAISHDGALLVSASNDRRLRLWDARTGEVRGVLAGHTDGLTGCAISPDGTYVVSSSLDGTVRIWDTATAAARHTLARAWREKNEGWFVSANDQGHWSAVQGCAVSFDGRWVASASSDQTLIVWDAQRGEAVRVLSGHEAAVNACCFSPDGRWLASAGGDRTLRVWDAETGAVRAVLHGHRHIVTACSFTADSTALVSASADGTVMVWDAESGVPTQTLWGHTDWINACAVSHDGSFIVSSSSDSTTKLWDTQVGDGPRQTAAHTDWVLACAVNARCGIVVTASADRSLMLWDAVNATPLQTMPGHDGSVRGCAVSADGRHIASASGDKSVMVWNASAGMPLFTLTGHRDWVNCCAIDAPGELLVSASNDRTLRLWDLRTRARKLEFVAHEQWINCCAFSPDGRFLVSAAADGSIRRWSLGFDEALWESWLSGSRRLNADVVQQALRPLALPGHVRSVNHCAFAPNGAFMVSASSDHSLRLWDVARGAHLATLEGHAEGVNGCDVRADSSLIASVSSDGALKVWRAADGGCAMSVHVDGELSACAWLPGGNAVVAVGALGVYFFRLVFRHENGEVACQEAAIGQRQDLAVSLAR